MLPRDPANASYRPAKAGDAVYGAATSAPVTVNATAPLTVAVIAPNGGEVAIIGIPITSRWSAGGGPTSFDVNLSRDGGTTFETVGGRTSLPDTAATCDWTPTGPVTVNARIRVTAHRPGAASSDLSDAVWTIANPAVTVSARNAVVTTTEGTPVSGILQATVSGGAAPVFSFTTAPVRGVVTIDPAIGAFTYTPNAGATGYDPFAFTATSGASSSQATGMCSSSPILAGGRAKR